MSDMETSRILEILHGIADDFNRHTDEAVIVKYRKYFKEGYHARGVGGDAFLRLLDTYWNTCSEQLSSGEMLNLIDRLFRGEYYEEQSLAILFLERMRNAYSRELFDRIHGWFDPCIKNWAHTDIISGKVLAGFYDDGVIELHDFDDWLTSNHKWTRRAVPVTLLSVHDLSGRAPEYLDMIRPLMTDDEEMVQKGVGWFLREAWKKTPAPVEEYLMEWKEVSPRLIYQYATEKMSKEGRQRFRRKKPS